MLFRRLTVLRIMAGALLLLLAIFTGPVTSIAQTQGTLPGGIGNGTFAQRYNATVRGNIAMIGNALITCDVQHPQTGPACIWNQVVGGWNEWMAPIDIDGDPTTQVSSRANLFLPSGSSVVYAALYYGTLDYFYGVPNLQLDTTFKFQTPTSGGYLDLTADAGEFYASQSVHGYVAYTDVTQYVQQGGNGAYGVAGVDVPLSRNDTAGWMLYVVYENPAEKLHNITLDDGYIFVYQSMDTLPYQTVQVTGLRTPRTGPITGRVGAFIQDGDKQPNTDGGYLLNGVAITNALNPFRDSFNYTITDMGTLNNTSAWSREPAYMHNMSIDIDLLDIPAGVIGNGDTTATFEAVTYGEGIVLNALTTVIQVNRPDINITKKANPAGPVKQGDIIEYTVWLENAGTEDARSVAMTDVLPPGVAFVPDAYGPGSGIQVAYPAEAGFVNQTNAPDSDHALYTQGEIRLWRPILVDDDTGPDSIAVRYKVRVTQTTGLRIDNVADLTYRSQDLSATFTDSARESVQVLPTGTVTIIKESIPANGTNFEFNSNLPGGLIILLDDAEPDDGDSVLNKRTFNGVSPGTYKITENPRSGWTPEVRCTGDRDNGTPSGGATVSIDLDPGENIVCTYTNRYNAPPNAVNDDASTSEDTGVTITVLSNDTDPENNPLTVTQVSAAANGTVTLNADNTILYVPNENFNGTDVFSYAISDGNGGTDTAMVTVQVSPVNDDPVAQDDSGTLDENSQITLLVLVNDSDPDGDTLTVESAGPASNGSVTVNDDGTITYQPAPGYNGTDSFIYTISDGNGGSDTATVNLTINNVLYPPQAGDDSVSTDEDTPVNITVLTNDSDADNDPISIGSYTQPASGSLVQNQDDTFTYTPNPDFTGTDSFTYTIRTVDGTATATVQITVTAENDPPVADDQSVTVAEDSQDNAITLTGSDADGDSITYTVLTQPQQGTLTGSGANWQYTPTPGYSGPDSFTFVTNDGSVDSEVATVSITVTPQNDPPVADDQSVTVAEDSQDNLITLTGSDADGDSITYTLLTQPQQGTLTGSGANWQYTPTPGYSGPDSFTFVTNDGNLDSEIATVSITVTPGDDEPVIIVTDRCDMVGTMVDTTIQVVDDSSDLSFMIEGLPDGLSYDRTIGRITGTIAESALNGTPFTVSVTVADDIHRVVESFSWCIEALPDDDDPDDDPEPPAVVLPVECQFLEGTPFTVIEGTPGYDELTGTEGNDLILGYGGIDLIRGLGGDDCILGGDGNDTLYGDAGADVILGERGKDEIFGGDGDDFIYGGLNPDALMGDAGNDMIYGEEGSDCVFGGDGDDFIDGGPGSDNPLVGNNGNDTIYGGTGDDELYGDAPPQDGDHVYNGYATDQPGDDMLYGDAGHDELHGDAGADTLNGGDGDDALRAGPGDDTLTGGDLSDGFYGGADYDTETDYDGSVDWVCQAVEDDCLTDDSSQPDHTPVDSDWDGIADDNDACPHEGDWGNGLYDDGCPRKDTDGDGMFDRDDACEYQGNEGGYGVDDTGCPYYDMDGDGVFDRDDACEYQGNEGGYGVDDTGCPYYDTDGDGVFDRDDACEYQGNEGGHGIDDTGCPYYDSDGDGMFDRDDACVYQADEYGNGVDASGCPVPDVSHEPDTTDSDSDDVSDDQPQADTDADADTNVDS